MTMSENNGMTTEGLFTACADSTYPNMNWTKPFNRKGWRVGTNGKICVRRRCDEFDTPGRFPDVESAFAGLGNGEPLTLPDPGPLPDVEVCSECHGEKWVEVYDSLDDIADYLCNRCVVGFTATGKMEPDVLSVAVGPKHFQFDYVRLLWEFGVRDVVVTGERLGFQLGEVEGAVMSCKGGIAYRADKVRAFLRSLQESGQ